MSEALCLSALISSGLTVLLPFGDNERYDFVVDNNGILERVQCKTGKIYNGAVRFSTSSSQTHRKRGRQNYIGQIEKFMVYCPQNHGIYLVPIDHCPKSMMNLRIDSPKNKQSIGIKYAEDYLFSS